jgi:uncharacterized protein YjiS (DUF1127 family)
LENDMTMVSSAASQPTSADVSAGLVRWVVALAHALAGHWERRSAIKTLSERDDRELRDIGIVRSQIEAAVGGTFNPHRGRMY